MDSKGLKMPVSGSDKMEASVLGFRLSEKAEHLPIKKRRFLFMNSSPPHNASSSEGTESVAASLHSYSQDVHLKPDANCPPAASLKVADLYQSESNDSKPDVQKLVKYSKKTIEKEDICTTSVAPATLGFIAHSVKLENMSAKETDFHIPAAPSIDVASSMVANSTPYESTVNNSGSHAPSESECTKRDQVISNTQQSAALDDRLNWDLNTVMAWEEQLESDHNCKEGKSGHYEQGTERGSVSENIQNEITPGKLKSLIPKVERSELEECKPVRKLFSPVVNYDHLAAINKIRSLHNQHAERCVPDAVPSALTLENSVSKFSAKLAGVMAAVTDFTFTPSGGMNIHENVVSSKTVGSGSNINHALASVQRTENDKLDLSLVTASYLEDDKANVKRLITSNRIAMENMVYRGTESSQNVLVSSKSVGSGNYVNHAMPAVQTTENEKLNPTLVTAASTDVVVHQSGSAFDGEDDKSKVKRVITSKGITAENPPAAVSSMHNVVCSDAEVPLQSGKSCTDISNNIISNNKEVCDYENFPSDIQAGSEVDNVDEVVSFGYEDSQFEDGEFRESSIQTWEGNDGEDRETEHGTNNKDAFGTHENDSLKSTDVGSQKGTDESSSVLLPEKLDSSDQISCSEPNVTENCTTEVNMKDASQSDQWKMNVSGSDNLPENHSSSNNTTKLKDFGSTKSSSSRVTEDLETKGELPRFYRRESSTRDAFVSRSRFRMQGSSSNTDDSASRSVRDSGVIRSVRRGKYTRGGGTWDRSPPFPGPSFRRSLPENDENLTDKVGVGVDPNVTRGPLRSRLTMNSEEDEFRARLGLRPAGETCQNRFVNVGRGRSLSYGSRHNDVGPRDRYYDEPPMDYSHSFPARHRCFLSGSTSPPRSRTRSPIRDGFRARSRSPIMRPDTRIRREPGYRHGFEPDHGGYNLEQSRNNNSPPSTRFLKYKQSFVFDRRSPPPPLPPPSGERERERLGFYESSRKTKPNENYRSSRFSELHVGGRDGDGMDHGYRRGGFARPYDMGQPVKHILYEEDSYGPPVYDSRDKEDLEFHGRVNPKPYQRRAREDRDKW